MTDTETEPMVAVGGSRVSPPTRRRPPSAPRPKTAAAPRNHADAVAEKLAALDAQIAELKAQAQGGMRTVESAPANLIGTARVADNEELTPWQLRVRDKTEPTPKDLERREKPYNYSPKLYMKPDGSVVSLQGDPQNFTYYTAKKKFHALTDAEVQEYLTVERPRIEKLQREKASLINGIRRQVEIDPALRAGLDPSWEIDLDRMTIPELRAQVEEIAGTPTADGRPRRMFKRLERLQNADDRAAEAEAARLMAGVETTPSRTALEQFEKSLPEIPRSNRTIEVTPRNARQFT